MEVHSSLQGKRILIIEDDPDTQRLIVEIFKRVGAQTYIAPDGPTGLREAWIRRPDLVILDVMLPVMDGFEIATRLLEIADMPIILATARSGDYDIIRGLDAGAVDYITKPFNYQVLLARARAALRRTKPVPPGEETVFYEDDYLKVDLEQHRVFVQNQLVKLTATEYRLLAYLVHHAGRVRTFAQILENVWGWEYRDNVDYVHVHMSHLRRKVEPDPKIPRYLLTEYGVGYWFEKRNPDQ